VLFGITSTFLAEKYRYDRKKNDEPEEIVKQEVASTALPSSACSYTPHCTRYDSLHLALKSEAPVHSRIDLKKISTNELPSEAFLHTTRTIFISRFTKHCQLFKAFLS
jgi:hypothetical protein